MAGAKAGHRNTLVSDLAKALAFVDKIVFEDRHLELIGPIVVLVIDEQHADEFLADINLRGIVLFRARHDADFLIAERALEISVELSDFGNVRGNLQMMMAAFAARLSQLSAEPSTGQKRNTRHEPRAEKTLQAEFAEHLVHRPR